MIHLYTIGFTKKSAEVFFAELSAVGVRRVVDIRLNNVSQLAGFTKKDDLRYFLKAIGDIDYVHLPILAPTKDLLDAYKKRKGEWSVYEQDFLELMGSRHIEDLVGDEISDKSCLLCSEEKPTHCHRRLVAEYLQCKWGEVEITHLS